MTDGADDGIVSEVRKALRVDEAVRFDRVPEAEEMNTALSRVVVFLELLDPIVEVFSSARRHRFTVLFFVKGVERLRKTIQVLRGQ